MYGYRESERGSKSNRFSFSLENKCIVVTGASYKFAAEEKRNVLFKKLEQEFPVFDSREDWMQVIYNHEIFTLQHVEEDTYMQITFPLGKISDERETPFHLSDKFSITCDAGYLSDFYAVYQNVNFEGNILHFGHIRLVVNGNQITIEEDFRAN